MRCPDCAVLLEDPVQHEVGCVLEGKTVTPELLERLQRVQLRMISKRVPARALFWDGAALRETRSTRTTHWAPFPDVLFAGDIPPVDVNEHSTITVLRARVMELEEALADIEALVNEALP